MFMRRKNSILSMCEPSFPRNIILAEVHNAPCLVVVMRNISMANYCLECGGVLSYDASLKQYVCKSCGLTFTYQQIIEGKDRLLDERAVGEDERRRRQKDYLKWWLSKK